MPGCALSTFLLVLAVNASPAAIVLLAGGLCWAATLALLATLASGAVTLLSLAAWLVVDWTAGGRLSALFVVGTVAALLETALAFAFFLKNARPREKGSRVWIVSLHDRLHGVAG